MPVDNKIKTDKIVACNIHNIRYYKVQNKNIITMVILILTMVLPWYTAPKNHGMPWYYHGNSYHGTPWYYHGTPWYYHGTVPWYTMVAYHGVPPQKTMVMYHGIFSVGERDGDAI